MEEQNSRLTTGSSSVHHRFTTSTTSALSSWLPTSGTTPFCAGHVREKSDGPLVSSQERRALFVLLRNHLSTAIQPRVLFSQRSTYVSFFLCCSGETRERVFDSLEGTMKANFLGAQFCWHPVLPDPTPPSRCTLRPDAPLVCPGFGFDRFFIKNTPGHALHEKGLQRQKTLPVFSLAAK